MEDKQQTLEEVTEPELAKQKQWHVFVNTALADFFRDYKLEKLTAEDGKGNKVKLTMTKDGEIKVEQSSTSII